MERERFSGCLIGQCLGDALGFAVEGHPPESCARYVADTMRVPYPERRDRRWGHFAPYTADSQPPRGPLPSYAPGGRFGPQDHPRPGAAAHGRPSRAPSRGGTAAHARAATPRAAPRGAPRRGAHPCAARPPRGPARERTDTGTPS